MSFKSGSDTTRRGTAEPRLDVDVDDWDRHEETPRDWKKLFLVGGLGLLSWVATYVGMLELIQANMGDLPLIHKAIIGFSVAMLMTMVIWLLDQLFAPIGTFNKLVYAAGYIFLTIISVGFGFGFYWKVLESRSEASRSAEGAVGQVQTALFAASTRLEQLQGTLESLTALSSQKAQVERASGTSCPNSKPGDGPRRKLRDDDAARFTFASDFVKGRVASVKGEMGALGGELAKITGDDKSIIDAKTGTRNEFMKTLSRKLDLTVTGFNAFRSDPQLRQIRNDLAERAERATFPDTKGATFNCPDPQLATALKGVVRAIDELPIVEKPKIAAVEGSEATIEAFRRLTATFYGVLSFKMPPSADELREMQKRAVQSVESAGSAASQLKALNTETVGLSKRDYVPLAVAIFVDLCLLLVSMGRPVNRLGGMVTKMRAAERGPVMQILSRFNDIHRDPEIRRNFEVFRHVVFDFHGDYYVAVPLDAPFGAGQRPGKNGRPVYVSHSPTDVADTQVEAHILANLFTSFEKERIFSRVYSPLLTTRTIQKRLARQGSKFAHARAFRVYRFKDGAWSEIILGAVMGAARRVEAAKRARNLAAGLNLPDGPQATDRAAAEAVNAAIPPAQPSREDHAQRYRAAFGATWAAQPAPSAHRFNGSASHTAAAPFAHTAGLPHSPALRQTGHGPTGDSGYQGYASPPTLGGGDALSASGYRPGAAPVADTTDGYAHAAKYGPYAAHVEPELAHPHGNPQNGAMVRPANNNTAPAMPADSAAGDGNRRAGEASVFTVHRGAGAAAIEAAPSASVIAMPGTEQRKEIIPDIRQPASLAAPRAEPKDAHTDQETVTYELKRETATVTVPVSKAAEPAAMFEALKARAAALSSTAVEESGQLPRAATPPPLPPPARAAEPEGDTIADADVIVLGAEPDPWTDNDAAVLRRFAGRGEA